MRRLEVPLIAAVWAAAVAAIDPRGNFPAHDDWDFAVATWNFARTGHFAFTRFTAVSLRAQVLWGALWTRLFGESFHVLRASTLVLSLATLVVVHRILARAGAPAWARVAGPLALLLNPIYLWASCTFMTDVPYVFASAVALYFFVRGVGEERVGFVVAACAAVVVSWFVRQNGVVNLFPALAWLVWRRPKRWLALAAPIVVAGGVFGLILLFARDWLSGSPEMFKVHYHMWLESSFRLPEQVATLFHYIVFNAINCGLFFLPLTVPLVALRRRGRAVWIVLGVVAALVAYRTIYLAANGYLVPYDSPNLFSDILPGPIVFDFGVGPATLYDTWRGHPYPFALPHAARALLTCAAAVLASLLVWAVAIARDGVALNLARLAAAFGTLMLFASGFYYDRYALDSAWALAVALPLLLPWERRAARALAIGALLVLAFFSIGAVREYFSWSRARWAAFDALRARGVSVDRIEGGGEAEGLYELRDAPLAKARRGHPEREFIIAFNELPGYRVIERRPFSGFFGLRRGWVLVLRRSGTG